jgi:hypothetical protein
MTVTPPPFTQLRLSAARLNESGVFHQFDCMNAVVPIRRPGQHVRTKSTMLVQAAKAVRLRSVVLSTWVARAFQRALQRRRLRQLEERRRMSRARDVLEAWSLRAVEERRVAAAQRNALRRCAMTTCHWEVVAGRSGFKCSLLMTCALR